MLNNEGIGILGMYTGEIFGGKIDNLNILKKNNFNVPSGFYLSKMADASILDDYFKKYINKDIYICRSSADCEDGLKLSYAGLFKSIQNFYKIGNLYKDVHEIFKCIDDDSVKKYEKALNGAIVKNKKMNVLVQEYISGDISGIYFSNLDGNRILSFIKGGNKFLVDGNVDGTNLYMDKDYNILKYEYNKQEYFMNDNLEKTSYNQEIHLNDEIFIKLINEFKKIEELFNYDVDIEWTIKNDIIYILQVRPITINI